MTLDDAQHRIAALEALVAEEYRKRTRAEALLVEAIKKARMETTRAETLREALQEVVTSWDEHDGMDALIGECRRILRGLAGQAEAP